MYWKDQEQLAKEKVKSALVEINSEILKKFVKKLDIEPKSTRKADIIDEIGIHLSDQARVLKLFEKMDETQQMAVAETIYKKDLEFDPGAFFSKYGARPSFKTTEKYRDEPTVLAVFIFTTHHSQFIPEDLAATLRTVIPKPADFVLTVTEHLPETCTVKSWSGNELIPLKVSETENAAVHDFFAVLRLIEEKKITVSEKTSHPSSKTTGEIDKLLSGGDFYQAEDEDDDDQPIGAIKGFAWPMILQSSKFVSVAAKKLVLSNEGRKALTKPPHEIIKSLWQSWQKTTVLDEFSRINEIKGQHSKGKSTLTEVRSRREAVASSLEVCPVNEWISIEEFFRCVRINFNLEITKNDWNLYLVDSNYGRLGYSYGYGGYDQWYILEGRYTLAVLFEYAAVLGLIDIAFIPPGLARSDYRDLWGADDLSFLSRYDGLKFIRVNNLGAFCLDLDQNYQPPEAAGKSALTVLPDLRIKVTGEGLSSGEEIFLEAFAEQESAGTWRLSREKTIDALEKGQKIEALGEFLKKREEQLLPETVEGFLRETDKRSAALKDRGAARIIECENARIADEIAANPHTKKICQRVGESSLAVLEKDENKFKELIRKIGYGMKQS